MTGQSAEKQVRPLGPLGEELRHRIRTTGPVPFEGFMRLALYHPTDGYYATRVPGHGADYRTSPSISPWFGRLVGGALRRMWEDLGRPDPFWVIEVGAGLGDLAAGAMDAAGPMTGALRWRFVELFDRVAGWQRRRLGSAAARAEWTSELGGAAPVRGCVLANEVLDAFPVHILEVAGDGDAREVCVGLDGDRFVEVLGLSPSQGRFLNLPFYQTGQVRKDPIGPRDVEIILGLLEEVRPHIALVAGDLSDPHGTHRMCHDAVVQALQRYDGLPPDIWYYRGAWQEWSIPEADILIPLSEEELRCKISAIFKHQSQKDRAPFPGVDEREFWQRIEERNKTTASLVDQLGLPEYFAMEALVVRSSARAGVIG